MAAHGAGDDGDSDYNEEPRDSAEESTGGAPLCTRDEFICRIREATAALVDTQGEFSAAPAALTGATLKDYQHDGYRWICTLHKHGVNGILADEMGLGKTVQAIAFLLHLCALHTRNIFLVVAPLSIVENWRGEIERFAPSLHTATYVGTREQRETIQSAIMQIPDNAHTAVLSTFEYINRDIEFFASLRWQCVIVDEAHKLKNYRSLSTVNIARLPAASKLLLTGTPIHNNLAELSTLLWVANSTLFYDDALILTKLFPANDAMDHQQNMRDLREIIKPFILRREKELVIKELPVKREVILYSGISKVQKQIYKSILRKDMVLLDGTKQIGLNNVLMQLRKCVNHPYIFSGVEPEPFRIGEHLVDASGKLWILDKLLAHLSRDGHRVLLFSQMTAMLDILQDYLQYRGYSYERLDGSIRSEERFLAVKNFTNSDSDTFVFLLSTRAGGVGLNLAQADTVIFYDSDFNPQMDLQAASRAHRIGQSKPVLIVRLVARGTMEELIIKRAEHKLKLSLDVLKSGAFTGNDSVLGPSVSDRQNDELRFKSTNELAGILKYGLGDLMADDEGTIEDQDLAQILALRDGDNSTESSAVKFDDDKDNVPDSIYTYGGVDYSKKIERDSEALQRFQQSIVASSDLSGSRKRKAMNDPATGDYYEQLELQEQLAKQKRDAERREKLAMLWLENAYASLKIEAVKPDADAPPPPERRIRFVVGDVSKPDMVAAGGKHAVIVHCVDNSGMWSAGGVFGALGRLSPAIAQSYSMAHRMKDLAIGDCHMVDVPSADYCAHTATCDTNDIKISVALIVAQRRSKSGSVSGIDFSALEKGLYALSQYCVAHSVSAHMPRLGQSTPDFDWYRTEKIIAKTLIAAGVPVYVYYFRRSNKPRGWADSRLLHSDSDDNNEDTSNESEQDEEEDKETMELSDEDSREDSSAQGDEEKMEETEDDISQPSVNEAISALSHDSHQHAAVKLNLIPNDLFCC